MNIHSNNQNTLGETHFNLPGQKAFYRGKIREVFDIENNLLVIVATDRISAFDHILPRLIPGKGAILNSLASFFLKKFDHIVPSWLLNIPDGRAAIGLKCEPIQIEMVVRGYLCGHALREYSLGKRALCGINFPEDLLPYQKFESPIITPSTKAKEGHDEDISEVDIIKKGLVSKEDFDLLKKYSHALFEAGSAYAATRGLILADTKFEFGKIGDKIYVIDEILTPDSSRYFYKDNYEASFKNNETPKQLSKEFVREWLISKGFQGLEGQKMPEMDDAIVENISDRYKELYEHITGERFEKIIFENDEGKLREKIVLGMS